MSHGAGHGMAGENNKFFAVNVDMYRSKVSQLLFFYEYKYSLTLNLNCVAFLLAFKTHNLSIGIHFEALYNVEFSLPKC